MVDAGLNPITIIFSEEISVDQSSADLVVSGGSPVSGASASVDRADRKKMTIQTSPLQAGTYTVNWKAVTEDDNGITNGTLAFTVTGAGGGATSSSAAGGTTAPLPQTGTGGAATGLPLGLIVALLLVASGLATRRAVRAVAR